MAAEDREWRSRLIYHKSDCGCIVSVLYEGCDCGCNDPLEVVSVQVECHCEKHGQQV